MMRFDCLARFVVVCAFAPAVGAAEPLASDPATGLDVVVSSSWDSDSATVVLHLAPAPYYELNLTQAGFFESAQVPLGALLYYTGMSVGIGELPADPDEAPVLGPVLIQWGDTPGGGMGVLLPGSDVMQEVVVSFELLPGSEAFVAGCSCDCPFDINCDGFVDESDWAIIALLTAGINADIITEDPSDPPFPAGSGEAVGGLIKPSLNPCEGGSTGGSGS